MALIISSSQKHVDAAAVSLHDRLYRVAREALALANRKDTLGIPFVSGKSQAMQDINAARKAIRHEQMRMNWSICSGIGGVK